MSSGDFYCGGSRAPLQSICTIREVLNRSFGNTVSRNLGVSLNIIMKHHLQMVFFASCVST
jgi:hypothetical protein